MNNTNVLTNIASTDSIAAAAQTYRIVIEGLAENIAIGRVTKIQYQYWENINNSALIDTHLHAMVNGDRKDYSHVHGGYGYCKEYCDSTVNTIDPNCDNEFDINGVTHYGHVYVPDHLNFMDDKYWMEHDDIDSLFGACANNEYTSVMVYDENDSLIFESNLNRTDLSQHGVQYTLNRTINVDNDPTISHYAVLVDSEHGTFCNSEFTLSAPFDPSKLSLGYTSFQGMDYVDKIFYDGIKVSVNGNNSSDENPQAYFYKKRYYGY